MQDDSNNSRTAVVCITQRFFLVLSGLLGLAAALHRPAHRGARLYGNIGAITALSGGAFSTRQLYLQSLPAEQAPACGPSIEFIFDTFPLLDALEILLRGDGNCAEVSWRFLGLSIPGWTLLAFLALAFAWLWQIRLSKKEELL